MTDHGRPTDRIDTVDGVVSAHAARTPAATAVTAMSAGGERRSASYSELDDDVTEFARELLRLGVCRRDRVGFLMPNAVAYQSLVAYFGTHRSGAVATPINTRLLPQDIVSLVRDVKIGVLVYDEAMAEHAAAVCAGAAGDIVLVPTSVGAKSGFDWPEHGGDRYAQRFPQVGPDDMADWLFTSGTTGRSKCVMLTHRNVLTGSHILAQCASFRCDDVLVSPSPLFTSGGLHIVLAALTAGAHAVVLANTAAEAMLETVQRERASVFHGAPAFYEFMYGSPQRDDFDLTSIRTIIHGGAATTAAAAHRIYTMFPRAEILNVYGLTESGNPGTYLPGRWLLDKPGSIGNVVMSGMEMRVVDDDGAEVARDGIGELHLRGPSVMVGYYDDAQATADALHEGWLRTGDIVRVDADGFLFVYDRKKDLVNRGGFKISSVEVESVIAGHPSIREAAVVAGPHPQLGEVPIAFVVANDAANPANEEDLAGFCREHLADFKAPRRFVFVPALPRNPSGKVLKRELLASLQTLTPTSDGGP